MKGAMPQQQTRVVKPTPTVPQNVDIGRDVDVKRKVAQQASATPDPRMDTLRRPIDGNSAPTRPRSNLEIAQIRVKEGRGSTQDKANLAYAAKKKKPKQF